MNQSFLVHVLIRILLIAGVSFGIGWALFSMQSIVISVGLFVILFIQIINLIHYQNSVNERIRYFFEAVKNEDFSQAFSIQKGDKIIQELNQSLQEINRKIQQIKIENHQQEQYFRALIEHVGTGILTYDDRGFVIHANSTLKKMLGLEQFTHLKQLERIDDSLLHALKQIQQQDRKLITFNGKQGKVNVSIRASSFKNKDQTLTLLSVQDINRELDEKELDSWMRLIRVLTHEIMNSIAPVTSLSESLASYFQKDGKAISPEEVNEKMIGTTIRGLEVIREQGRGLIKFVESYRKLTRLPKPDKKVIRVNDLLEKMILLNQVQNQDSSIQLEKKLQSADLDIQADEKLISQVLINLIKNSREALAETENARIVLLAGRNKNGQVEICVKDNGPGIPTDMLDEIFVPFFTTRENGSGIGLSLSRQILRLHGGSLNARSVPNKETLFCLLFNQ
ncbi:ATP-binding protein [uncultured Sunxiuqinia sp.]|uniref:sensor histidine kinase n=1 Tax=uncultured Sunxiuqinia sp. TaxID=1573825 RepID=UPI0030DDC06A